MAAWKDRGRWSTILNSGDENPKLCSLSEDIRILKICFCIFFIFSVFFASHFGDRNLKLVHPVCSKCRPQTVYRASQLQPSWPRELNHMGMEQNYIFTAVTVIRLATTQNC